MARKYELRRRADQQSKTRQRIIEAAVELHGEVGPAHTTDQAIAQRAGVNRRTFYRHFSDSLSLFRACTQHGLEKWPPPDLAAWRALPDPQRRLEQALVELYDYYGATGRNLIVMRRDAPLLTPEVRALPSRAHVLAEMVPVLLKGWGVAGRRLRSLRAAVRLAVSVTTWHELVVVDALTNEEAVALLCKLVLITARSPSA